MYSCCLLRVLEDFSNNEGAHRHHSSPPASQNKHRSTHKRVWLHRHLLPNPLAVPQSEGFTGGLITTSLLVSGQTFLKPQGHSVRQAACIAVTARCVHLHLTQLYISRHPHLSHPATCPQALTCSVHILTPLASTAAPQPPATKGHRELWHRTSSPVPFC